MKKYIKIIKSIFEISNSKAKSVMLMFLSCFLYNIASLLPPIATSGIISVITNNDFNGIWFYVVLYAIFYIVYFNCLNWNYKAYTVVSRYYQLEVQKKIFEHVSQNTSIFKKISKGKIVSTCSDDVRYIVDCFDCASEALMKLIKLVIIYCIFLYYNVIVGIIAIIFDLLYLKLMSENSKKISKYYEGQRKYEDKIIDIFSQVLSNIKQIKTFNIMPKLNNNLERTRTKWKYDYNKKRENIIKRYSIIPYIVYICKIVLYVFLGYLVVNKKMTIDKLVLLISYFEMTITCSDETLEYLLNLGNYGIRINRIKAILDYNSSSSMDFGDVDNDYINGTIVFDKVTCEVDKNKAINNVSFKIFSNEITAIVGHSGAGKTTIVNILHRLYKIKSGCVLIDDENIYNYSQKVYTSNVSGTFQKPFIFEMSIKDNLSLFDSNTKNQIDVCKRVGIHDFIMSLPKGYNTIVTEEYNTLTNGQIQLLSIARALLTKSEILIFDEVTSNIDPNTTEKVANILIDLKQDHTVLMITHKPEMMEIADKVIVLDKGKIVAKGHNKEVFEKCELYRELRNRTFASLSKVEDE